MLSMTLLLAASFSASEASPLILPTGEHVELSLLAEGGPVAIVVIKGDWCPACREQLASLSKLTQEISRVGGRVLGLSIDSLETNRRLMQSLKLAFAVLRDQDAATIKRLGLYREDFGALPGVIFVDRCGKVASVLPGRRPGLKQDTLVLRELKRLTDKEGRCRPSA